MKKVINAVLVASVLAPTFVFAQQLEGIENLVSSIGRLTNLALPIVVGLALLAFFWGLLKFIFAQGNEESKADAKKIMLWGIIALFVMVSVWGLVDFIGNAFGIDQGDDLFSVPGVADIRDRP